MSTSLSAPAPFETYASGIRSTAARTSLWICIPWIWFFLVSTRSLSSWLANEVQYGTASDPDLSGSPVDRVLLTLLLLLGCFVVLKRWQRVRAILARNKWVVLLFAYMTLSVLWSNFPAISFRRGIRSAGVLVMILVVLTEHDPFGSARALLRSLYAVHIPFSILAIKYFRTIGVAYNWSGIEEQWVGLCLDKNNLGQVAMCGGAVFAWGVLRRWATHKFTADLLLLVLTLWLLRGSKNSHSSTAILGFIASVAVLLALQFVRKRTASAKRIVLTGTLLAALAAPVVYVAFQAFDTTPLGAVAEATGRDTTFTGRTGLWQDLLDNAKKNPVLGVGFGAFWVGQSGYDMYPLPNWSAVTPEWRPGQGHNGFLDVYVELGAVGLFLLLGVIIAAFAGALGDLSCNFEWARLRLALLISILINNLSESTFLRGTQSLWFVFLLVAITLPRARTSTPARSSR